MKSKKILIVEDDKQLQMALKDTFEVEGFTVLVASDGQDGLEVAKKENPDIILIDILLPKINGITMAEEIKILHPRIKMIFLTNLSDIQHIADASDVAFTDYLVKSDWDINDIVKKVKEKLDIK